jgi:hypothetical protein
MEKAQTMILEENVGSAVLHGYKLLQHEMVGSLLEVLNGAAMYLYVLCIMFKQNLVLQKC